MTSGGPLPSGTLSGIGGIEAWGQKAGDEYKAEMYSGVAVPANKTSAFSNGIPGVIGFFIDALVSALVMGLKGITGGLIDLTGALKATDTKATNAGTSAAQAAADAAAATAAAQTAAAGVAAAVQELPQVKAVILAIQDGLPIQPYDHSMTNHECSFDHASIVQGGSNTSVPPLNSVDGVFIRAKWAGSRQSVVYSIASVSVSTPLNPFYILVGRMNPETGNVVIEHVSANQGAIVNSPGDYIYNMQSPIIYDYNETMWVATHQPGPSANSRSLYSRRLLPIARQGLIYPPQQKNAVVSSAVMTANTMIQASSLDFSSPFLPWLGIGQPIDLPLPAPTSYFEDFQSGAIPASMTWTGSSPDKAVVIDGAVMVGSSLEDGERAYTITKTMKRSDGQISSTVRNPTARLQYLVARCDAAGFTSVLLGVSSTTVGLYRTTGLGSRSTVSTASVTNVTGDAFKLRYEGTQYTIYKQAVGTTTWVPVLSYTDSAGAMPSGTGNRYTRWIIQRSIFLNSGGWEYILVIDKPDTGWAA